MSATLAPRRVMGGRTTSVALGIGFMAVSVAVLVTRHRNPSVIVPGIIDCAILSFLAAFDSLTLRAPNRIVYPSLLVIPAGALLGGGQDALDALGGGIAAFTVLALVQNFGHGAMGFGDVKVGALAGLVVGLRGVLPMLGIAFASGGVVAAAFLSLRIGHRKDSIAFTPFLAFGVVAALASLDLYLVR